MKKFISALLLLAIILPCLLVSCDKKKEKFSEYALDYFDTATTITGYAESKEQFDEVCSDILSQLEEYHKLFTIYHKFEGLENLCTINELEGDAHRVVTVDQRIIDMLLYSKEMYTKTNGKVNVAMGSVLSIWHNYRTQGLNDPASAALPSMDKLTEAAAHTDINDLVIDEKNRTVFLADPKMTLDVGAVAKGYAVEMIAQSLEQKGIEGYVLNVGGNVRTIGAKGDGEKWLAGIDNPIDESDEPYIAYLNLAGESLVTSGSYQRYYVVNGKNYHHIIDPETLMPAERYLSISIVCKSSADGDALSTALFCMSYEDGAKLVGSLDGIEAMWVFTDGSKKLSDSFSNYLTQPKI